ncbi:hypothetical protein ACFE04_010630 [Oxalis oulophora]
MSSKDNHVAVSSGPSTDRMQIHHETEPASVVAPPQLAAAAPVTVQHVVQQAPIVPRTIPDKGKQVQVNEELAPMWPLKIEQNLNFEKGTTSMVTREESSVEDFPASKIVELEKMLADEVNEAYLQSSVNSSMSFFSDACPYAPYLAETRQERLIKELEEALRVKMLWKAQNPAYASNTDHIIGFPPLDSNNNFSTGPSRVQRSSSNNMHTIQLGGSSSRRPVRQPQPPPPPPPYVFMSSSTGPVRHPQPPPPYVFMSSSTGPVRHPQPPPYVSIPSSSRPVM